MVQMESTELKHIYRISWRKNWDVEVVSVVDLIAYMFFGGHCDTGGRHGGRRVQLPHCVTTKSEGNTLSLSPGSLKWSHFLRRGISERRPTITPHHPPISVWINASQRKTFARWMMGSCRSVGMGHQVKNKEKNEKIASTRMCQQNYLQPQGKKTNQHISATIYTKCEQESSTITPSTKDGQCVVYIQQKSGCNVLGSWLGVDFWHRNHHRFRSFREMRSCACTGCRAFLLLLRYTCWVSLEMQRCVP